MSINSFIGNDNSDISYYNVTNRLAEQYAEENYVPNGHSLLPPEIKKEKLKLEFLEQIEVEGLDENLVRAFEIIENDGQNFLTEDQWTSLEEELRKAGKILENFDYDAKLTTNYAQFLGISDDSLDAINTIARAKFQEDAEEALSLLVLLTTLEDDNAENWYELAICYQQKNLVDQALSAYVNSLNINPNLGSKAFLCECYLALEMRNKARETLEQAQQLMIEQNAEDEWGDFLKTIESNLGEDTRP